MTSAFPQGLVGIKSEIYYDGDWNENSDDVRGLGAEDGKINISTRAPGIGSDLSHTTAALSVHNQDGKYSYRNVLGSLYGKIGPNTPLRIGADVAPVNTVIDNFNVDSASGWPNSESGHAYTQSGGAATQFVVSGGDGIHRHASTSTTYTTQLANLFNTDFDVYMRSVRCEAAVTGAGTVELRLRARIASAGADRVELFLLYSVGADTNVGYRIRDGFSTIAFDNEAITGASHDDPVDVRLQIRKNKVKVKGWLSANAEPTAWNFETTTPNLMPGSMEIETNVSAGVTNAMPFDVLIGSIKFGLGIILFTGEVVNWPKEWDPTGNDVWVPLTVVGITNRLRQGNKPLRSAIFRYLSTLDGINDYWDFENLSNPDQVPSAFSDGKPMVVLPNTTTSGVRTDWSANTSLAGSGALPTTSVAVTPATTSSQSFGTVVLRPVPSTHDEWSFMVVSYAYVPNDIANHGSGIRCDIDVANSSTVSRVSLTLFEEKAPEQVRLVATATDSAGATVATVSGTATWTDEFHVFRVKLNRTGGTTLQIRVYSNESLLNTGVSAGAAHPGQPTIMRNFRANFNSNTLPLTYGHVAIASGVGEDALETNAATILQAVSGWNGELATVRFERVLTEEGIAFEVIDSTTNPDTTTVGPQRELNVVDIVSEPVHANDGLLYELKDELGYGFRTRQSLYEATVGLSLDYANPVSETSPGLEVTDDSTPIRNRVTVTRLHGGETVTVEQTEGPNSTASPVADSPGAGLYETKVSPDPNLSNVNDLVHYAGFRLLQGTWDESRWPVITAWLHRQVFVTDIAQLLSAVFLDMGDILSVVNNPVWIGPDDAFHQIRGAAIELHNFNWSLEWLATPAGPFMSLGVLDNTTYGRLDTDGSVLVTAVDNNDTDLIVVTENMLSPYWTEEPAELDSAGFSLRLNPPRRAGGLGGEKITVGDGYDFQDTFARSASSGWGTSDSGHVTSTTGGSATDYSVSGGLGNISHGTINVRRSVFYDTSIIDFDLKGTITCPVTPTGASIESGVQGRFVDTNNYVDIRLFYATTGVVTCALRQRLSAVDTTIGFPVVFGTVATDTIAFRFQAVGNLVRAKFWLSSDAEPVGWKVSMYVNHIVAGDISVFSGINSGNTNPLPVVFTHDNFLANEPRILPAYYDRCNRTVANGLGSANVGGAWTTTFTGAGGSVNNYDVAPSAITTVMPDANAYHAAYLDDIDLLDCCVSLMWTCPLATGASLHPGGVLLRGTASNTYILCRCTVTTTATVTLEIIDVNAGVETTLGSVTLGWLTHVAATTLRVKVAASGDTISMKLWDPAFPNHEPSHWHLEATDPAPLSGFVGFRNARAAANTNVNPTPTITDFRVDNPQRITVQRGVNNGARAWDTSTDVRLWSPLILAR